MNTYCANSDMQHITELSAQKIYNGLRHFYILFLLSKNTLFPMERIKRVTSSMLISLIYKLESKPVTSTDNILSY